MKIQAIVQNIKSWRKFGALLIQLLPSGRPAIPAVKVQSGIRIAAEGKMHG